MAPSALRRALPLVVFLLSTSCLEEEAVPPAGESAPVRAIRQEVRSTNKVLILGSSVSGGLASREAQAVAAFSPSTQIDVVTAAQWRALSAVQFMAYRALIVGEGACASGTEALQAAIDTRNTWGAIVDGSVALVSTDPTHNHTGQLVESAIAFTLDSPEKLTGMYVALGCAYQDAAPQTPVPLLEPFGAFEVEGVGGCASGGHIFQMKPSLLSENLGDELLSGDGCAARSVFTRYPSHTFAVAALALRPGGQPYSDFSQGDEQIFTGTPYLLVRGAMAFGGGCGTPDPATGEECDLGDFLNGAPATPGQQATETCSWSCRNHWCGDGHVDTLEGEECDDGVNNGRTSDSSAQIGACTSFCKRPVLTPPSHHPPTVVCRDVTVVAENTCGVAADINNGSSDPDGDLAGCTASPAGPYAIGATTVTLTCTDREGNSASCSGVVRVTDHVLPTIALVAPATQSLECAAGSAYNDPGATGSDLCEGPLPVVKTGAVNLGVPSTYTLSYDVTDSSGNSAPEVTRTVIVSDTLPPTLSLRGLANEGLECGTLFNDLGATASDQCAGNLTGSIARTGTVNPMAPGVYPLRYNVKDPAGHPAQEVSRIVTVADTLKPEVTVTGPLTQSLECGAGAYVDPGATASDACAGALAAVPSSVANPSSPGTYSISYSATDPSGNTGTSSSSRTVTVSDTLPPTLTLNGTSTQTVECGSTFADPGATAADQCAGNLTSSIVKTGAVNPQTPGSYALGYSVSDGSGHTASSSRTVTVADTLKPEVTVTGPLTQTLECGAGAYVDPGATASDACAGTLTAVPSSVANPSSPGTYSISYSATDPSGNTGTSSSSRTVTVSDTLPPTLTLNGTSTQTVECGSTFADPGATATDQCVGNLTSSIVKTGAVNPQTLGSYTLSYSVSDGASNTTSKTRTVNVNDTLPPTLTLTGSSTQTLECGTSYSDPGATASDQCAGTLTSSIVKTGTVNSQSPGSYTLGYSVSDGASNTTSKSRTITVSDTLKPVVTTLAPLTQTVECGSGPYTDPGATASDACAGTLTAVPSVVVNPNVRGTYTVGYTATDPSGNKGTSSTSRTVTVSDTLSPTLTLNGASPLLLECGATFVDPGATASDQCAGNLTSSIVRTGSVSSSVVGNYTLSYSVSDGASHTVSKSRTVTVKGTTIKLSDYNVFVLQNYSGGRDVRGKVAAGGDITMTGFSVGQSVAASNIAQTLVAGGKLSLSSGTVWGDAYYGTSYSGDSTVTYQRGTLKKGSPINFTTRFTELRSVSSQLATLTTTGTVTRSTGYVVLALTGTDAKVNVFNVDASQFVGINQLAINAPASSLVVINILGTSATLANFGFALSGGITAKGILYNLAQATTVNAGSIGLWGTLLAPNANVTFNNGAFDGGIYAVSLTGTAEGHLNALNDHLACQ